MTTHPTQRHVERIATSFRSGVSLRASEAAPHDGTHSVSLVTPRLEVARLPARRGSEPCASTSRMDAEGEAGRRQGRRQKGAGL